MEGLVLLRVVHHVISFPHSGNGVRVGNLALDGKRDAILTDRLPQEDVDCGGQVESEVCEQRLSLCFTSASMEMLVDTFAI